MKRNLSVMVKTSSSKCNINCKYCFYNDITCERKIKDNGFLIMENMKIILDNIEDYCNGGNCTIGFQGGEPLLIGLDFYKETISYIKQKKFRTSLNFSLQTNGILITKEWANFFKINKFLIGVSLDGNKAIHNLNRINFKNEGTFNSVLSGIKELKKFKVPFNILSVITPSLTQNVEKTFDFFIKNDFNFLQFIPDLDIKNNNRLSSEQLEKFLIESFDLWYSRAISNKYLSIRYFDNILSLLLGTNYESCDMSGSCTCQQ